MILQPSHRYQATILVKTWEKLAKELVKVLDSKQISTPTGKKNAFRCSNGVLY
jgi:hypothetical protein